MTTTTAWTSTKIPPQSSPAAATPKKKFGLLDIMSEELARNLEHQELLDLQGFELPPDSSEAQKLELENKSEVVIEENFEDLDLAYATQLQEEENALYEQSIRFAPKGHVTVTFVQPFITPEKLAERQKLQLHNDDDGEQEDDLDGLFFPEEGESGKKIGLRRSIDKFSRTVEDDTTRAKGLDKKTSIILHKIIGSGIIDSVNGVIRTGKEGVIYHAVGPNKKFFSSSKPGYGPIPSREEREQGVLFHDNDHSSRDLAIKVYKTNLNEFSNRHEYIEGDHRFRSLGELSKQNDQKVVRVWAEKEFKNLTRMHRAGIPCPEPVRLYRNVLIMSFIGKESIAAPSLVDLDLKHSKSRSERCFVQSLLLLRAMYDRCNLVHCDFSEYNILYLDGKCFLVDVGQAVEKTHPNSLTFLRRDISNILAFFSRKCENTGCGDSDENVDKILSWIIHGCVAETEDLSLYDGNKWKEYANEIGKWTDTFFAAKVGNLLNS